MVVECDKLGDIYPPVAADFTSAVDRRETSSHPTQGTIIIFCHNLFASCLGWHEKGARVSRRLWCSLVCGTLLLFQIKPA